MITENENISRLAHFPLAFFATVMGISGLSISWMKAAAIIGFSPLPGIILAGIGATIYVVLLLFYAAKLFLYKNYVKEDLEHPIKLNFFATISINILLLTICAHHIVPALAEPLFIIGAFLHLCITFYVLNCWIHRTGIDVAHLNPAWFIPVVGNIVVPVAMPQSFPPDLGIFFFSVGLVFWICLLSVVLNRLFFHQPIPERLMPTLAILIAPPAIGFLAYYKLTGGIDFTAQLFLGIAFFFTLLLATNIPKLYKIPFALSWWAYSFPLTAVTTACLVYAKESGFYHMQCIALFLLAVSSLVILLLAYKTLGAIRKKSICNPE